MNREIPSAVGGLAVGVLFLVLLATALHPKLLIKSPNDVDLASRPLYQQQAVAVAKESKVFDLFQVKNPFAYVRSVDDRVINTYDNEGSVIGSEAGVQVVFVGDTLKAQFDVRFPTQVPLTSMVLHVRTDLNGNVRELELRCIYSLVTARASTGAASGVYGEDDIIRVLTKNLC